jgi:hypothetical protein
MTPAPPAEPVALLLKIFRTVAYYETITVCSLLGPQSPREVDGQLRRRPNACCQAKNVRASPENAAEATTGTARGPKSGTGELAVLYRCPPVRNARNRQFSGTESGPELGTTEGPAYDLPVGWPLLSQQSNDSEDPDHASTFPSAAQESSDSWPPAAAHNRCPDLGDRRRRCDCGARRPGARWPCTHRAHLAGSTRRRHPLLPQDDRSRLRALGRLGSTGLDPPFRNLHH